MIRDVWVTRARPAFLYVIYLLLLCGLPVSLLSVFSQSSAVAMSVGLHAWLTAIPDSLYIMAGTIMSGYGVSRTIEKLKDKA